MAFKKLYLSLFIFEVSLGKGTRYYRRKID